MKICLDPDNANLNTAQPNPIILGQTEHRQHFTLVKCHICSRTFDTIAKFSHHLRSHKLSPKIYYDTYIKKDNEGKCAICGKETTFRGLSVGYLECCSTKCSNKHNIDKIKLTKLNRYGSSTYNNQDKAKNTCIEKYGVSSVLKLDDIHTKGIKAARSKKANQKRATTNNKRYGANNVFASNIIKNKIKQTNLDKYGVEYSTQNPNVIAKIKETNLQRYGVECNLNIDEVKNKIGSKEVQIKRANSLRGKPKHSKLEQLFEDGLCNLGYIKDQDYYCQYRSDEYPFMCDFYLVHTHTYIEINGYWMHNSHAFDKSNTNDIAILNNWKEKSKQSKQYQYAIHIWTESDVEKRKYGKSINLVELWNATDIMAFLSTLKEVN